MKSWPSSVTERVINLNNILKIDHNNWHKFKGNQKIRAAELISSALCQLVVGDNKKEAIAYLEESIKWLKGINVDRPCPDRKKSPL